MMVRRSRGEPGKAKAQTCPERSRRRRTNSRPSLVLGSALAFSPGVRSRNQLAGRSKAQVHCLRSGGLAPRWSARVNSPD